MNPDVTVILASPPDPEECFPYGWRDVKRRLPNGDYVYLQLALTPFDVLHPQEGDCLANGSRHADERRYFASVLSNRYRKDPSVLVLSDTGVYWDIPGLGHHSPDLSVIFHIDRPRKNWEGFYVAQEGVRPVLLLEVVTPKTRVLDTVTKLEAYHRAEVPCYAIIDREHPDAPPALLVYRWTAERYEPVAPNADGRLLLEPLGLLLGFAGKRIVLFEEDTGAMLGDLSDVSAALEALLKAEKQANAAS